MNKSRPKQMSFRLSEKEYRQLKERISKSGLSSQDYLLRAVMKSTQTSEQQRTERNVARTEKSQYRVKQTGQ